ncbi:MAG: glycosyltransferase family 4 protein [Eubacteriales bacterium]|nr:glycosyltransferase family 4 protein [Eubacteriales bacterium]
MWSRGVSIVLKKVLVLSNVTYDLYSMRREVVQALLNNGYDVSISAILGRNSDDFKSMGCKMIDSPVDRRGINPFADFKLLMHYFKLLKANKPDIVLTYTIKPNLYGGIACSRNRIPYLSNVTGLGSAEHVSILVKAIIKTLYKWGLKKSNCIFYQNEDGLKKVNSILNRRDRYKLIPGSGVNIEHFGLLDYPNDDKINFLFISRIMKEKGIDQYLEAAEAIKKVHQNVNFHILGFCEEDYEDILNEYEKRGVIQYHGMQNDVRAFHKFSHCTIHPTYYSEGISNVLLESASSGRPVITTDRFGTRETVEDGITGFLFKEKNTKDLVEKIERFLSLTNEQRKEMGIRGRLKVIGEFDRQIVVNEYLEKVKSALHILVLADKEIR